MHSRSAVVDLDLGRRRSFACVVERGPEPTDSLLVLLGGLSESRSGHNYLLRDLSRLAVANRLDTVRYDWAGQADSLLPLDLDLWQRQFERVLDWSSDYRHVHVVLRGAARAAVPSDYDRGSVISVRPVGTTDFDGGLERVLSQASCAFVRPVQGSLAPDEERLWSALGVETRAIGGLSVNVHFLERVRDEVEPSPPDWTVIFPSCEVERAPEEAEIVLATHPLFLLETERARLGRALEAALARVAV